MKLPDTVRIKTGVPGLDNLVGGGFLHNSVNLVTGETGTGKTLLCCQFLWHGLQRGETGIYITLEENPEDIKEDAKDFGWDFDKYIKKDLFRIIYHDPAQVNNLSSTIIDEIRTIKAKRLVIDSTSLIGLSLQSRSQVRKMLLNMINVIKRTDCTALLISEIEEGSKGLSRYGVEEFVVDGVLVLNYLGIGETSARTLIIRKMRRTDHGTDVYPIEIGKSGISIKPID